MDGFDIAVITPCLGWDSPVRGPESFDNGFKSIPCAILPEATDKFTAVVGLDDQQRHFNAALSQMLTDDPDKQTGIVGGFLLGIAQKHQPAAYLSGSELVLGQL